MDIKFNEATNFFGLYKVTGIQFVGYRLDSFFIDRVQ